MSCSRISSGAYFVKKMMNLKYLIKSFLVLILLGSSVGYGQHLRGKVSDDFGPLIDVEIAIENTNVVVYTNEKGEFVLPLAGSNGNNIIFSYTFYNEMRILGLNVEMNEIKTIDLKMELSKLNEPSVVLLDFSHLSEQPTKKESPIQNL